MPQKRYSGLLSYPQWVQRTYMVSSIAQYLDGRKAAAVGSCSALTTGGSGKVPQICHLELDASDGSRRCPIPAVDHTKENEGGRVLPGGSPGGSTETGTSKLRPEVFPFHLHDAAHLVQTRAHSLADSVAQGLASGSALRAHKFRTPLRLARGIVRIVGGNDSGAVVVVA